MAKIFLTPQQIEDSARRIAFRINHQHNQPVIFTFSNGGIDSLASFVRYLNYKPLVYSFDPKNSEHRSAFLDYVKPNPEKSIFLDDILDTGKTIANYVDLWQELHCFFLVNKIGDHRLFTPPRIFAGTALHTSDWVVFPWEKE